ncbi:MAG: SurA N-terminal domain-containing protein [Nitrospinota bacterium]
MLQFMRDYTKSWMIKIILWTVVASFIGTIFLVWGMGRETSAGIVATVEGKRITFEEYQEYYNRLYEFYKKQQANIKEDVLAPIIKRNALDSIIMRKLQLSIANQEGLRITNDELIDDIQRTDIFKKNGRFDKDIYIRILGANRINPAQYEESVKEDLLIKKLENFIKDGVKVSRQEVIDAYTRQNEKVNIDYIMLGPPNFLNRVTVMSDKLEEFYKNNSSLFQRGEEIVTEYILSDPKNFEKDIRIEDAKVSEHYNSNIAKYRVEKRVKARHILIALSPDADEKTEKEAKEKALKVLQELKAGGDFAELAKKYSDDPSVKDNGGDLGYFSKGQMVKLFEDAAFALKEGELSEPVKTQFGFHIIKVEKIENERTKPLAEVRGEILKTLTEEEARKRAKAEMEGVKKGNDLKVANFNQVIKGHTYLAASTENLKKDDRRYPVLSRTSFALKKGEISEIVEDGGKFYILRYKDKKDAFIPKLEEIRIEVEGAYRSEEAKKILDLEVGRILEDLKNGKELSKTIGELKLEKVDTGYVTRDAIASRMGRDVEVIQPVFNAKKGEYIKTKSGDRYFIVYIKDRSGIDEKKFQEGEKEFAKKLLGEKQNYTYQRWLENTKKTAEEKGRIKITKGFV